MLLVIQVDFMRLARLVIESITAVLEMDLQTLA